MMTYALAFAAILIATHSLWVYYVALMRLKMLYRQGNMTPAMKWFTYPTLGIGFVLDFFVNVVGCSFAFLETPCEWTVSARLYRHSTQGHGWRQQLALALRTALLDDIDPDGIHIG